MLKKEACNHPVSTCPPTYFSIHHHSHRLGKQPPRLPAHPSPSPTRPAPLWPQLQPRINTMRKHGFCQTTSVVHNRPRRLPLLSQVLPSRRLPAGRLARAFMGFYADLIPELTKVSREANPTLGGLGSRPRPVPSLRSGSSGFWTR
jgi:hypothetical protein